MTLILGRRWPLQKHVPAINSGSCSVIYSRSAVACVTILMNDCASSAFDLSYDHEIYAAN